MDKPHNLSEIMLIFAIIFAIIPLASAHGNTNISLKSQATGCMQKSIGYYNELKNTNFSVMRVNDSITEMKNLYDAQIILKDRRMPSDFSLVLPYCKSVKKIRDEAFASRDKLSALMKFYNESLTSDMNKSTVDKTINQIKKEIYDERYENVDALVDTAYKEIINIKSEYTTLNVFYKSTMGGVKNFLENNWIPLSSFAALLVILLLFYRATIGKYIIKRKISNLEMEKQTLKKLIQKTQRNYFEIGDMSESDYNIRMKNFSEMIRDIDRQIPLLREEFIKIEKRKEGAKNRKEIIKREQSTIKKEMRRHKKK